MLTLQSGLAVLSQLYHHVVYMSMCCFAAVISTIIMSGRILLLLSASPRCNRPLSMAIYKCRDISLYCLATAAESQGTTKDGGT